MLLEFSRPGDAPAQALEPDKLRIGQRRSTEDCPISPSELSITSIPAFWPIAMASALASQGAQLYARNLKFVEEETKIHDEIRPSLATPNRIRLDLRTMILRDYGTGGGIATLVDAPHAGHTAMIADFRKGQSLIETLLAGGIEHVALTDWKAATEDMKDLEIDNYLAEMVVAIDDLGGRVNLVGLCSCMLSSTTCRTTSIFTSTSMILPTWPRSTHAA
jgi:hypothetical protein